MGGSQTVLTLGFSMGEKRGYFFSHSTHEPVYPFVLAVGRSFQQLLPVGRMFQLLAARKGSWMVGYLPITDEDLEMIGVREDRGLSAGIVGGNGVTVGLEGDKGRDAHGGRDEPVRFIRNSGQGHKRFLSEGGRGRLARGRPFWQCSYLNIA